MWAFHHELDEKDAFPATAPGDPPASWRVRLLPRLDQNDVFNQYDFSQPWNAAPNLKLTTVEMRPYQCPTDRYWSNRNGKADVTYTAYAAAIGPGAALSENETRDLHDVRDGSSHTLVILEACGQKIIWSEPRDVDISTTPIGVNLPSDHRGVSPGVLSSQHSGGGAFAALADGSCRLIPQDIDPEILRRLLHCADGLPTEDF